MSALPLSLRAMIYPEGSEWVAHCLDLDIVETGESVEGAVSALAEAVATQLWYAREHDNFANLFQPAPLEAWQRLGAILGGPHRTLNRVVDDRKQEFTLIARPLTRARGLGSLEAQRPRCRTVTVWWRAR